MINARVEGVTERPAFRRAFERFRCLIIADGFYEWQAASEAAATVSQRTSRPLKQAFHITRSDRQPFAFAGLWSIWRGEQDGATVRSCAILTTAANAAIAPLHDRMPVILRPDAEEAWIDPATPAAELHALLDGLPSAQTVLAPVGPAVNDARYDGPECLGAPVPIPTLF